MFDRFLLYYVVYFNIFIAIYLLIYTIFLMVNMVYGALHILRSVRLERLHNVLEHDFYYPISIMIPLYNEGKTGLQTVDNVLKQDYRLFEIIIIDDGSTDDTKQLCIDRYHLTQEIDRPIRYQVPCQQIKEVYAGIYEGRAITLISKVNGRTKADAVNAGINVCNYPYFVNMDGDEILQKDALKWAARAILEEDNVIGVGGNLRISNGVQFRDAIPSFFHFGKNLLPDIQTLEYGRNFAGARIFHNVWNANLIISGGYGVFKKSAVVEVGGYDSTSMGEDMEMTIRLHKHFMDKKEPYVMKYVEDSVCWTQAPHTFSDLRRQRQRWQCGLVQTIGKYKKMILNPKYGIVGMFMFPYMIAYELITPILMLMGWLCIAASFYLNIANFPFILFLYILFVFFSIVLTMLSYFANCYRRRERISFLDVFMILGLGLFEAFVYRTFVAVVSFAAFFKKKTLKQAWKSPTRVEVKAD
ncbi:MAG: glycosyltransferase [Lachnospiraceae bacterium]|nr:glycosyltransferase [Lachnospiraceae bacterium]